MPEAASHQQIKNAGIYPQRLDTCQKNRQELPDKENRSDRLH